MRERPRTVADGEALIIDETPLRPIAIARSVDGNGKAPCALGAPCSGVGNLRAKLERIVRTRPLAAAGLENRQDNQIDRNCGSNA